MKNKLEYLQTKDQETGLIQVIYLEPLIQEFYNVNYDLTCAISNIINLNSDICIFKIQKQLVQQVNHNQQQTIWDYYQGSKKIEGNTNKDEMLQQHFHNFKEQLFIKFSIFDEKEKSIYLNRCQNLLDFIFTAQKDVMYFKRETQNLVEEVQDYCQNNLTHT